MKSNLLIFAAGVAIGAVSTKAYFKKKSNDLIESEIESVKNAFKKKREREEKVVEDERTCETEIVRKNLLDDKPDIMAYASKLVEEKYVNYAKSADEKVEMGVKNAGDSSTEERNRKYTNRPYVIAPEQFGYLDGYETVSLTYYNDHVLANDDDEIVKDIDKVIGLDALNQFGVYEDHSVFVRNDELMIDYEVLLDERNFSDIPKAPVIDFDDED